MSQRYDALLKNGMVVDPATTCEGIMDVAVAGGKIADIAPDIDPTLAEELFDVRGYHAVPGMSNGQLVMYQGHVCGRGGRFITTATGAAAVRH
ncbi:MAG: hypothetical protein ACHQ7N_10130 [Candidatus Methylomirabilales bacterium]